MTLPSYPGVYIKEFTPGAPIQGVGTSTAAFLGPSQDGTPGVPVRLTSWDRFKQVFGAQPVPGTYLWYAVRGFFENGGTACYVVRTSTATYDRLVLKDHAGQDLIDVRANGSGVSDPAISVAVTEDNALIGAKVFRPTATATAAAQNTVTFATADDAAQFRPGDGLKWTGLADGDVPVVVKVDGPVLRLANSLTGTYSAVSVGLADLAAADKTLRLQVTGDAVPVPGQLLRLTHGTTPVDRTVAAVITERVPLASSILTTYRVTFRDAFGTAMALDSDIAVQSFEFKLTVVQGTSTETYGRLGVDTEHPRYYASVVDGSTGPVVASPAEHFDTSAGADRQPAPITATNLAGGTADQPGQLQPSHYIDALATLTTLTDVNQVLVPGRTDTQVQVAVVDHCSGLQNRFAVLDSRRGASSDDVHKQLAGLKENHGYGALYYPWLLVPPATGSDPVLVPPSGHVAGIYARTDAQRGVHKAPAGNDATLSGALGVETAMTDTDQGALNLFGVNAIRVFSPGARPVVWGARTTSLDTSWQYVNIRRLFIFLEQSLQEGLRWVVFEPNNPGLWLKVKRTATDFLTTVWRTGALFGGKPEDAFYVRIDEALNPFSEQALGRLNIEIGVRPSYPAEFVVVNIGIWPGGSEISEG